jgi:solute:Na+ symporter, SSS family
MHYLDIIIASLSAIAYVIFIIATRKTSSFANYAIANRSAGVVLLFATMSANYIGPGFTLGLVNQGYTGGYFYLLVASFYGVGKIIEGLVIAPRLRAKFDNAYTIGDVIGGDRSHNHKAVRVLTGFLGLGLTIGLSVVMSKAGGEILNNFLGVEKQLGTCIVTILVMSYSVFGGIKTTMLTDAVQFTMFMILLPALALLAVFSGDFNASSFTTNANTISAASYQSHEVKSIIGLIVTWFFGEMLIPPTISSILSSDSSVNARKALSLSGALMVLWLALMLTLGIIAFTTLGSGTTSNDQVLLALGKQYFPVGMFGLFAVAMIGVVMSSQDSLINTSSVIFSRDILNPIFHIDEKQSYTYSRIAGLAVGVLSIIFAVYIPSIISGLLFFYTIWVPSILVPCLFSIFRKRHVWQAAIASILAGFLVSATLETLNLNIEIPNIILGLISSVSAYLATTIFIGRLTKEKWSEL